MPGDTIRIPLLRDWHSHPFLYSALHDGINLWEGRDGLEPSALRQSAVTRIHNAAMHGDSRWTIAHGWNDGRYALEKSDFDALPPVVVFNVSLHKMIVNDAGRSLLERSEPKVAGRLDDQSWTERNLRTVLNVFASASATALRLQRYYDWLLADHGVWHAEEMLLIGENELQLFDEAELRARTRFWASPDVYDALPPPMQSKVHGVKLFSDGALGAWTAALHEPYRGTEQNGMLIYQRAELEQTLEKYLSARVATAVHAIGDRAIDQVVAAVETIGKPADVEMRLEHVQLISEVTAQRAKALGVRLCMQPNFSDDSIHYADRLPRGCPERNNPFRMLIDQVGFVPGDDLLLGSDGMPHGVREGLRQSLFPPYEGQRLSLEEFIAGYCMPDDANGSIEVEIDALTQTLTVGMIQQPTAIN
jgi:predicted amidohydrolase YtcJ